MWYKLNMHDNLTLVQQKRFSSIKSKSETMICGTNHICVTSVKSFEYAAWIKSVWELWSVLNSQVQKNIGGKRLCSGTNKRSSCLVRNSSSTDIVTHFPATTAFHSFLWQQPLPSSAVEPCLPSVLSRTEWLVHLTLHQSEFCQFVCLWAKHIGNNTTSRYGEMAARSTFSPNTG